MPLAGNILIQLVPLPRQKPLQPSDSNIDIAVDDIPRLFPVCANTRIRSSGDVAVFATQPPKPPAAINERRCWRYFLRLVSIPVQNTGKIQNKNGTIQVWYSSNISTLSWMLIDGSIAKSVTNVSIAAGNEYKNLFRQTRCADVYVWYGTRAKCCWWRACPLLQLCNKCLPRSSARGAVRKNDMDVTYYGRAG